MNTVGSEIGVETPHHLGFAVADLDAAMGQLGALHGLTWREPVRDQTTAFRAAGRHVRWTLSYVMSAIDDGLVVELLQGAPGTTWHTPAGIVFHHYAFAPQERARYHAALIADGWRVELTRDVQDVLASTFAYFVKPGRPRVELCLPDFGARH